VGYHDTVKNRFSTYYIYTLIVVCLGRVDLVFSKFLHFAFYSQPSTLTFSWTRRGLELQFRSQLEVKCMYLFGYAFRLNLMTVKLANPIDITAYDTIIWPTIATTSVLTSIF